MSLDIENTQTELSDYEKLRINNIKRNNAKLRALGLISSAEEEESNARAEGKLLVTFECDDKISTKKRKRQENPAEGPRKSLRLQGIGADLQPVDTKVIRTKDDITEERIKRVQECREVRLRAAKAVAAAGAEKAAKENPTATYEHCLMRVKSMTEKGLANRVSQIHVLLLLCIN